MLQIWYVVICVILDTSRCYAVVGRRFTYISQDNAPSVQYKDNQNTSYIFSVQFYKKSQMKLMVQQERQQSVACSNLFLVNLIAFIAH